MSDLDFYWIKDGYRYYDTYMVEVWYNNVSGEYEERAVYAYE